jgi:hypothetical protein
MLGGQPSIIQPIAGLCDSHQVVNLKTFPNVLNDKFLLYNLMRLNCEFKKNHPLFLLDIFL